MLDPRWFYQLKEGEWESLTGEQSRFFEQVVGFKSSAFKPSPNKKSGRVIDNQDAAKAWLAFIGFADEAGDRVTHFFSDDKIYDRAFASRPSTSYWNEFAVSNSWEGDREGRLEGVQGDAHQYLLAYFVWQYINAFVPSPQRYRELALNEGVKTGKIKKSSDSFVSSEKEQDEYLAGSGTYQTWRLMANMKELLAEVVSQILTRKYGPLDAKKCGSLLNSFEAASYQQTADVRDLARAASSAKELSNDEVFGRILRMLQFVCEQFWENKKQQLLSTSRLRTYLLKREISTALKALVWEYDERTNLDRIWKPQGTTFLKSLPSIPPEKK